MVFSARRSCHTPASRWIFNWKIARHQSMELRGRTVLATRVDAARQGIVEPPHAAKRRASSNPAVRLARLLLFRGDGVIPEMISRSRAKPHVRSECSAISSSGLANEWPNSNRRSSWGAAATTCSVGGAGRRSTRHRPAIGHFQSWRESSLEPQDGWPPVDFVPKFLPQKSRLRGGFDVYKLTDLLGKSGGYRWTPRHYEGANRRLPQVSQNGLNQHSAT